MKKRCFLFVLLAFAFVAGDVAAEKASRLEIPETDEGLPGVGVIRRYPWFQNLWKKKRTGWSKEVQ